MSGSDATLKAVLLGEDRSASKALKGVGDQAEKTGTHLHGLGKIAAGVFAGGVLLAGAHELGSFLSESARAAIADEQANAVLAKQLHNTAHATADQVKATEEWLVKQAEATGVAKSELTPALTRLVSTTHDVGRAQKLLAIAQDVSAGSGKALGMVVQGLIKAQTGSASALSRFGIVTKQHAKDTAAVTTATIAVHSAQTAYEAALKKYGPTAQKTADAARMLAYHQTKLAEAHHKVKTSTITTAEAVKRLATMYKGDAAAAADTAGGRMKRLGIMFEEMKVSVGNHLLPALTSLAGFLITNVGPAIAMTVGWLSKHKEALGYVLGALTALFAVERIHAAFLAVEAAGGLLKYIKSISIVAKAMKVWTAVQWLLNAAMSANPVGLVIIAVAALVAIIVVAWKKSDTFRQIVTGAFHAVLGAATAVWNWVKQNWPLLLAILTGPIGLAVLFIVRNWDKIRAAAVIAFEAVKNAVSTAIGAVIGFFKNLPHQILTALGNLGTLLFQAGKDLIMGLINGVGSMASALGNKMKDIAGGAVHAVTSFLGINSPSRVFHEIGQNIMFGLIEGIDHGTIGLKSALSKVLSYIATAKQNIASLMQQRDAAGTTMQGFASSVFGSTNVDAQGNTIAPTAASMLTFQAQQRNQAFMLRRDVARLTKMGLSKSLIGQLLASGSSGIDQIHALAQGSASQIRRENSLNAQTLGALNAAGLNAGNALYGDAIAAARRDEHTAVTIRNELEKLMHLQDKNTIVQLKIGGRVVQASLLELKRNNGGKLLGLA